MLLSAKKPLEKFFHSIKTIILLNSTYPQISKEGLLVGL